MIITIYTQVGAWAIVRNDPLEGNRVKGTTDNGPNAESCWRVWVANQMKLWEYHNRYAQLIWVFTLSIRVWYRQVCIENSLQLMKWRKLGQKRAMQSRRVICNYKVVAGARIPQHAWMVYPNGTHTHTHTQRHMPQYGQHCAPQRKIFMILHITIETLIVNTLVLWIQTTCLPGD